MSCPLPDSQSKTRQPYRLHLHYPSTPETHSFPKTNPHAIESVSIHALVSGIWLQWRGPRHNQRIFVGHVEAVETAAYVPAVIVTIAEVDRIWKLVYI